PCRSDHKPTSASTSTGSTINNPCQKKVGFLFNIARAITVARVPVIFTLSTGGESKCHGFVKLPLRLERGTARLLRLRIIPSIDRLRQASRLCTGLVPVMNVVSKKKTQSPLNERLATRGFRFTPQREHVYAVLLQERDHPTAEEVFIRAKGDLPDISMATVYNCLAALVKCGLVRQVALERGAARFCPNMQEHCHFYCESCDGVFDVDWPKSGSIELPRGFKANRFELAIHGQCPACA